jgi:glycerophosphoryl diester phosphodiesterase
MKIGVLCILLLLCVVGGGQSDPLWKPAPLPRKKHRFVVIAHRGDHVHAPENSLLALQEAIRGGADYVEVDLRTTHDGHIVIMHDSTVDRTTNGKGKVSEMTLSEVRSLHLVDRRFHDLKPEPPPTFEEILQQAKGKIYLYLDAKAVDPAQVLQMLKQYRMERSVVVYTGTGEIGRWRKDAPKLPLMISPPREAKTPEALEAFWKEHKVELLDGDYDGYTVETVSAAKQWQVEVWTDIQSPFENPKQWATALKTGLQGLQTDHPADLLAYLKEHKQR